MEAFEKQQNAQFEKEQSQMEELETKKRNLKAMMREFKAKCKRKTEAHGLKLSFSDTVDVDTHLQLVDPSLNFNTRKALIKFYENSLKAVMHDCCVPPLNKQIATALAVYRALCNSNSPNAYKKSQKASLWHISSSQGKSIIIAIVAALFLVGKKDMFDKVVINFINPILREKDEAVYEQMGLLLGSDRIILVDS